MSKYETTPRHIEDLMANDRMLNKLKADCEARPENRHFVPTYEAKIAQNREAIAKLQSAL